MGGVDTNDQMMSYQNFPGNLTDGGCLSFLDLLNQAIVNAWILQQFQPNAKNVAKRIFELNFQKFSSRKTYVGQQANATKRYDGIQHFVVQNNMRGYCMNECGSKIMHKCTKCDIFLCIGCYVHTTHRIQTEIKSF